MDQTGSNKLLARVTGWVSRRPLSEVRDIYKFLYQAYHGPGHIIQSRLKQGMITLEHNISAMIKQGIIDSNVGIELANDPDDLLEFLLEDSAKYKRRREREQIVMDEDEALRMLISEWAGIEAPAGSHEPVSEPVHIEGVTPPLFMIHLSRAKAAGIEPGRIASLFLRTGAEFPGSWPKDRNELHEEFKRAWREIGGAIEPKMLHLDLNAYNVFTGMVEGLNWPAVHHSEVYRTAYDPHYRLSMWEV